MSVDLVEHSRTDLWSLPDRKYRSLNCRALNGDPFGCERSRVGSTVCHYHADGVCRLSRIRVGLPPPLRSPPPPSRFLGNSTEHAHLPTDFVEYSLGQCCKSSEHELFYSGVGWSNSTTACRTLCIQHRACAFFSIAAGTAACRLCRICTATLSLKSRSEYQIWRRIHNLEKGPAHLELDDPLRIAASLGEFSTKPQHEEQMHLLAQVQHSARARRLMFVGDSTVRYQWMHLVRTALDIPLAMTLADGIHYRADRARMRVSPLRGMVPVVGRNQSDRGGSGDLFWSKPSWMVVSTKKLMLVYVRQIAHDFLWLEGGRVALKQCDLLPLDRMRAALYPAWPPDVVLWNTGLHLLHLAPRLTCVVQRHCHPAPHPTPIPPHHN